METTQGAKEPTGPVSFAEYERIASEWDAEAHKAIRRVRQETRPRCRAVRVTEICLMAFTAKGDEVFQRMYYEMPEGEQSDPEFCSAISSDDLTEYVTTAIMEGADYVETDARADPYWRTPPDNVDLIGGDDEDGWYTPGEYINPPGLVWSAEKQ